jgi:hypothetical protein
MSRQTRSLALMKVIFYWVKKNRKMTELKVVTSTLKKRMSV